MHPFLLWFWLHLVLYWCLTLWSLVSLAVCMSSSRHKERHFCSARKTNFKCKKTNLIFFPQKLCVLNLHGVMHTWTCERSLSLNCKRTWRAPSSLNSFRASIARSSKSLCDTKPGGWPEHNKKWLANKYQYIFSLIYGTHKIQILFYTDFLNEFTKTWWCMCDSGQLDKTKFSQQVAFLFFNHYSSVEITTDVIVQLDLPAPLCTEVWEF